MIDFKDVSKFYSGEAILDKVTFRVNPGDRVGVVGPNGAGKSTIFSLISGDIEPDKGEVLLPKNMRIGLLKQHLPDSEISRTLLDFTADAIPELKTMHQTLHDLEQRLHTGIDDDAMLESCLKLHGELQSQIEHLGAYQLKSDAAEALSNLGFGEDRFDQPLASFSGGWRMRAALARVLIARPDILLLDEPSNYLDIPAVEWLCRFLKSFPGTLLLISHDRFLLRKLASVTMEVNSGKVTRYAGDYDYYRTERENRLRVLEAEKRNVDRKKEHLERVIDRFRAKSSKAAQAKSWQKALDKIDDVELPDNINYSGAIRFPEPPPGGTEAARLENITFGYTAGKNIFENVSLDIAAGDKLAFIGYNGMGKTTFLKLLVGSLKPQSGRVVIGHRSILGYQSQEFADLLVPEQTVYDTVRGALPAGANAANLMNILGSFGFSGEAADKRCKVLSGGEKIRLLFARIFVNPPNLLILDEPTTHLDIAARELLQEAIRNFAGTVCVVSHDIEFVRNTATSIIAMEPGGIRKYFGNYDYYLEKASVFNPAKAEAPAINSALAKDRRRARAQARAALAEEKVKAEKRVKLLEDKLQKLETRQAELLVVLGGESKVAFAEVNKELSTIQLAIESTVEEWESAALSLEEILKENAKIHQD